MDNPIVMLVYSPDDGTCFVPTEEQFIVIMTADTYLFNPQIDKQCAPGNEIDGYMSFTRLLPTMASNEDCTIFQWLYETQSVLNGFDFDLYRSVDGGPLYYFLPLDTVHPSLLEGVIIKGYEASTSVPTQASAPQSGTKRKPWLI